MELPNLDSERKWMFFLGIFLFFLVAKEAYTVPLTHDEYNTIVCSQTSFWDIVTYKDPVPNNHILNTLFIKLNIKLFGDCLFTNRLHNFLFFIPFFIFTVLSSRLLFKDTWVRITLIFLIVLQPFLLDFFAVTRGYGLSVAFQMISIYYLIKRIQLGQSKDLIYATIWAGVSVYANFTLLNYFIPLMVILSIDSIRRWYGDDHKKLTKEMLSLFGLAIFLLLIIIVPVQKMVATKQFVYWGSKGFFEDTAKHLILNLRSGVEYFGSSSELIYHGVLTFIIILFITGVFFIFKLKDKSLHINFFALPVLIIIYNLAQFHILNVPFLNARTALFFIPVVAIPLAMALESIYKAKMTIGFILILIINALMLQHFIRGYNVKVIHEWSYDSNTFEVLDYLKEQVENGHVPKPVKINCYWIFYPSLKYHIDHGYNDYIEMAPYNTKIEDEAQSLFYYTESGEKEKMLKRFEVVKEYSWGSRLLMKAKPE